MSQYPEQAKNDVGDAVKQWLLESYSFTTRDIDVFPHTGHESYVTVEIQNPDTADWTGFRDQTEHIRTIVRNTTEYSVKSIPTATHTEVSVRPE